MLNMTKIKTEEYSNVFKTLRDKDEISHFISSLSLPDTNSIISALSHDLRSPLNSVIGFSDILLSERIGELNEEQKKQISIIHRRGAELLNILDQLVEYCKIIHQESNFHNDLFALAPFLNASVEKIWGKFGNTKTNFDYTPPEDSFRIVGDEHKVFEILEYIFDAGFSLMNPRKIGLCVKDVQSEKKTNSKDKLRIEIAFYGKSVSNSESLFVWNGASNLPGRIRFAMHLSQFYSHLMGGDLSGSCSKGHFLFNLDLCKDEL